MNKNVLSMSIAIVAIAISLFAVINFSNTSKIVYVDINKLIEGYEKTEEVRGAFKIKATQLQSNVDSIVKNWQVELQDYEKTRSKMSKKELALKQELLSNKQQQVNNYQEAIKRQLQEEDQKNTQTILNDINSYVKDYGKKENHTVIFGATGSGNIMYASEESDLTSEILEALNKDYK